MSTIANDTHPAIHAMVVKHYRAMSGWERLQVVRDLNLSCGMLVEANVRQRHPSIGEKELRLRVASRSVPRDLMRKATGWDVEVEGY